MDVLYATETGYTVPDTTTRLGDDTAPASAVGSPAKVDAASVVDRAAFLAAVPRMSFDERQEWLDFFLEAASAIVEANR